MIIETDTDYQRPTSLSGAGDMLGDGAVALAGGTDLIQRMKSDITAPAVLVDIKRTGLDADITVADGRVTIGALATLSSIAACGNLDPGATALRDAAASAATVQIRNRATLAGNLLQRPRCPYYRLDHLHCWLKGGDSCFARDGVNEHHAIFDTDAPCIAVHPSDPANALVALGATATVRNTEGADRRMAVEDLLQPPTQDRRIEHVLSPAELITGITFETPTESTYVKVMDRATWAFALTSVAVAIRRDASGGIEHARAVAGGVANVPRRLQAIEDALLNDADDRAFDDAISQCAAGAEPMEGSAYKVDLLRGAVRRALAELSCGGGS